MRKKISLILLILIFALFTNGCSQKVSLIETKEEYFTAYANENISIKISNTVKDNENIYNTILESLQKINGFSPIEKVEIDIDEKHVIPKVEDSIKCNSSFIDTEEFKKELIKRSYDIYDNWISEGLYVNIFDIGKKDLEFSKYYENHEFSLFGARFFEPFASKDEVENVQAASIDLVEYLIKKGKKEELLRNQVYISDIEEWANDRNIDLSYQRGIDSLMNRMEVNKLKPNIYLTLNTKEEINGFTIDINTMDEQYDTAKKIEDAILKFDADIVRIREGIKKDAPNFYRDYSHVIENMPKIHYYFDIDALINSAEAEKDIVLKSLLAQIHEHNHILIGNYFKSKKNNNAVRPLLWLDEGMANYLDVAYTDSSKFIIEEMLKSISYAKENDNKLDEEAKEFIDIMFKVLKENNIEVNNLNKVMKDKDGRINATTIISTMGVKFGKFIIPKGILKDDEVGLNISSQNVWPMGTGNHINYRANQSFTNYLIHEYGLEKLLYLIVEDFSTLTYEEYFGKSYEELKVDWIEYLKENIKAIELML
ncbi:hypothetical protein CIW83_10435 [Tissierella sp. P1]|uniref:hypothetical protein n=1 Tax=Tissierella sp. P1 TaxID=1280483 RepID=UPI000BA0A803|nr:hypothetical protein [Tissierella sp. P1]OZV12230.1 hypothetical protein CIW83_10435 [Tissierella sp. P1]